MGCRSKGASDWRNEVINGIIAGQPLVRTRRNKASADQPIHATLVDHVAIRREATKALQTERAYHIERAAKITAELGDGPVPAMNTGSPTSDRDVSSEHTVNVNVPVKVRVMKPNASTSAPKRPITPKPSKGPRLARRTADQVQEALTGVIELLTKNPDGMKAEAIRAELGIDVREIPRILKLGMEKAEIRSTGQKRATVYFANN
jgi:hypothetical protein